MATQELAIIGTGLSDGELVGRFYDGSDDALETLRSRWGIRLYGFFRKLGFATDDAEDLIQDTWVRFYLTRERRRFDLRLPLGPFLLTIARRLAINEWRSRKPQRETLPLDEVYDVPADTAGLREPMLEDLMLCIWALPHNQQLYVSLCGKHGLGDQSHTEIGTILGKWPAQLTQISQRARARLKDCMASKGYR